MTTSISLLDELAINLNYTHVSSLRNPSAEDQARLIQIFNIIPAQDHPLSQWNDCLTYILNAPSQDTPENARNLLLEQLSNP